MQSAQNYIDRQDIDGEKRVAFLSAADEDNDDHGYVSFIGTRFNSLDTAVDTTA